MCPIISYILCNWGMVINSFNLPYPSSHFSPQTNEFSILHFCTPNQTPWGKSKISSNHPHFLPFNQTKPKANKRGEEKKKETQWRISWLVNVKSFYERFIHIQWIICTNNLTSDFFKKKLLSSNIWPQPPLHWAFSSWKHWFFGFQNKELSNNVIHDLCCSFGREIHLPAPLQ